MLIKLVFFIFILSLSNAFNDENSTDTSYLASGNSSISSSNYDDYFPNSLNDSTGVDLGATYMVNSSMKIVNFNIVPSNFNTYYYKNVSSLEEFVFEYSYNHSLLEKYALRVTIISPEASLENPIMVVVKQRRAGQSWQLPLSQPASINQLKVYTAVSRVLCPVSAAHNGEDDSKNRFPENLAVDVSSQSVNPLTFIMVTEVFSKFHLHPHEETKLTVSPPSPIFLYYDFTDNESIVTVLVKSNSSICAAVAIQNQTCPVWDNEEDLKFANYYQTMTKQSAITVTKKDYPHGFFLILMTLSNDKACTGDITSSNIRRYKTVVVSTFPREDYVMDTWLGISSGIVFCTLIYAIVFVRIYYERKKDLEIMDKLGPVRSRKSILKSGQRMPPIRPNPCCSRHEQPTASTSSHVPTFRQINSVLTTSASESPAVQIAESRNLIYSPEGSIVTTEATYDNSLESSVSSSYIDTNDRDGLISAPSAGNEDYDEASSANPAFDDTSCGGDNRSHISRLTDSWSGFSGSNSPPVGTVYPRVINTRLSVPHLSSEESEEDEGERHARSRGTKKSGPVTLSDMTRKRTKMLERRSWRFTKQLGSLFIMYSVPALQLVVSYKNNLDLTGNLDICYYNFRCMTPVGFIADFSHVISNLGYVLLGILFAIITYYRSLNYRLQVDREPHVQKLGITRDFGLDYSLAASLVMEGVLSACYHVCPNRANFQFDTTFMYITALLLMLKLYQRRHPDIAANADTVFCFMALVVLFGVLGSFFNTTWFWVITGFVHAFLCFVVSCNIYYIGKWSLSNTLLRCSQFFSSIWRGKLSNFPSWCVSVFRSIPNLRVRKDQFITRLSLLIIANIGNWIFLLAGVICQPSDYDTYILGIFLYNLIIYVLFYICMKKGHGEVLSMELKMMLVIVTLTWSIAVGFYFQHTTDWSASPSQSKELNQHCVLFGFYDFHDLWHYLSALALFSSFYMVSIIDNDLYFTPRDMVIVF